MKTKTKLCALIGAVGLGCAPNLHASFLVTMTGLAGYEHGNGGEFTAVTVGPNFLPFYDNAAGGNGTVLGTPYGFGFETFCIEQGEHIALGTQYRAEITDEAITGDANAHGPAGVFGGDIISKGTAWLYSQFAQGILAGYDYTDHAFNGDTRSLDAGILQEALWYLEDEISLTPAQIAANKFLSGASGAITKFGASAQDNATDFYGVQVMNLYDKDTGEKKQDQLVYVVPESTTVIAGALLLLPLGASTLRILRRGKTA